MTSILVCIPTVPGRQTYLTNAARSYEIAHAMNGVEFNLSIVHDATSAGEGWQRCVDQGLQWWPQSTHVHFSNDDITVHSGWLEPLLDSCDKNQLPGMLIEPAGGHIEGNIFHTHPPMPPQYLFGVPRNPVAYFFAGMPEEQPVVDETPIDHQNLPFCSVEQWHSIGPFPPIHYGSDRWFAERGRRANMQTVARTGSVAFNYNANIGRHRGDWEEQDFAAFDGVFALPAYLAGVLSPDQRHPLRETARGLAWARHWRRAHETGEFYGADRMLMTDEDRFQLLKFELSGVNTDSMVGL